MLTWWRDLTIPQRFLVRAAIGMTFVLLVLLPTAADNVWLAAVFFLLFLNIIAAFSGLEPGFADWRPRSRAGRILRGWMYSTWWMRDGGGKRWVRLAWGLLGVAVMGLVAFGLAWSACA